VNQDRPTLSSRQRKVSHRDGIHGECALWLILALIDPIVGRRVEDQVGSVGTDHFRHLILIGQFDIGMGQRHKVMVAQHLSQITPQLPVSPDQERSHLSITFT
jgi:hypothetical protein